jgi:hypothetical protein
MDKPGGYNEICQSQKDKYCLISLTYGILEIRTGRSRQGNGGCHRPQEWGDNWPKGINF